MAEFSEVVKHKKRLCQSEMECSYCPLALGNNGKRMSCDEFEMQYPEEYEAIVMKWAQEHPAMTNRQKLGEIMKGVFEDKLIQGFLGVIEGCEGHPCGGKSCSKCPNNGFWDKEYQPPKEE